MIYEDNFLEEIKKIVSNQILVIMDEHPDMQSILWNKLKNIVPSRREFDLKFYILLKQMEERKEESDRRWEESQRRWEELKKESDQRWEESQRKWEESERKWQELKEESDQRWEESQRRWEESERKWQELKKESDQRWEMLLKKNDEVNKRIDRTIGALGARWGLNSEKAFRQAIQSILEELTGLSVGNYLAYDEKGEVFGHPEQIELDVVIKNGQVWLIEIKSSMSKADMYIFDKKVKFYEKREGKTVTRKLVISPMIDPKAYEVASKLEIETYCQPEYIEQ